MTCEDAPKEPPPEDATRQWHTDLRGIIRLLQCPACWLPLRKPVTLPCGKSFCQRCLPEPYKRQNISWPGTANRQWGIRCPNIECGREHAQEDYYNLDIMLRRVVDAVEAILQKETDSTTLIGLYTKIILDDPPNINMDDPLEAVCTIMKGGTLLAAYRLAALGELKRSSDPKFQPYICDAEALRAFDEDLLAQIKRAVREELNCEVCRIGRLVSPLTTPCGHTFCEMCLYKSLYLATDKNCPSCRRPLSLQFGTKPHSRPDILNAFLQHMDEVAEDRPTLEAEREGWGSISEERPMIFRQALFPSAVKTLHIPDHFRPSVRQALQGDKILAVCAAINGRQANVGTLAEIVESHRFEEMSRIRVSTLSRFRVSSTTISDDGCMVVKIRPLDDISLADEEECEIRETAGNLYKNVMKHKEDIARVTTKCLSGLATHVLHGCLRRGYYAWVVRGAELSQSSHPGQLFPYDPVELPWWFASIAPLTDAAGIQMLMSRSVRERLQICWHWLFHFKMEKFGLIPLAYT